MTANKAIEYSKSRRHLNTQPQNVVGAAEKLRTRVRELEKQLGEAQSKLALSSLDEILSQAVEIGETMLIATRAPQNLDANTLREVIEKLADKLSSSSANNFVLALASETDGKVLWAVKAGKGAVNKGAHAGNLIRVLATKTGGGGGGKPDFAQAGGKDATKIDQALAMAKDVLQAQLKA